MSRVVAIDFETYYDSKYSIREMIAEQYCADPRFHAYRLSIFDGETAWVGDPLKFNWDSLSDAIVLAHNKYFDFTVWRELQKRYGIPVAFREFHCTANLTSFLCNCRALADAAEKLYGRYVNKAVRSDMKGKQWSDLSLSEQEALDKYAVGDVEWCWRFWNDHSAKWTSFERNLSNLTIEQGMSGIQIDTDLLENYIAATRAAVEATVKTIPWTEDGKAPSSTQAVAWQCRKEGIACPPLKTEDEEGFIAWENLHAPRFPWVRSVSSYRSLCKLASTFDLVKERLRPDGTMPFALKYFGAHTGRWSGDAKINMQNPRKESVYINECGLMETDPFKLSAKNKDWCSAEINFRHLLIPRPGKQMITSDLSQIEPRVLAWCARDTAFMEAVQGGISPYEAHARTTMGWAGGELKKENPKLYALAKARVLGLGYGCGWEKFITVAATMAGLDITAEDPEFEFVQKMSPTGDIEEVKLPGRGAFSRATVKAFRESNPKITALWGRLDDAFRRSVGGNFELTLPSGRVMTYRKVARQCRMVPGKDGKPQGKWVYTADMGHKRESFYGGKLTENLVQATARDVFGEHMLSIHQQGIRTLFSCHDELIVEVDTDVKARDIEAAMSQTPEWLRGCPIAAEAKSVKHYCK